MPYFYLYDSYLQDRASANQLIRLEATLTDLGIQGKIGRLTLLKSVRDLVEAAVRDGADTVVAVGNDTTLSRVAEVLAKHKTVTLGFVPLGQEKQNIAKLLGIPVGLLACHVLSSRIVEQISLGKVNNQFFIQSIVGQGTPIIECENQNRIYKLNLTTPHNVKVCNLDQADDVEQGFVNPQNDFLEIILQPVVRKYWWQLNKPKSSLPSFIPAKTLKISSGSDEMLLTVDGHKVIKTPVTITVAAEHLKIIVGKKRLF